MLRAQKTVEDDKSWKSARLNLTDSKILLEVTGGDQLRCDTEPSVRLFIKPGPSYKLYTPKKRRHTFCGLSLLLHRDTPSHPMLQMGSLDKYCRLCALCVRPDHLVKLWQDGEEGAGARERGCSRQERGAEEEVEEAGDCLPHVLHL